MSAGPDPEGGCPILARFLRKGGRHVNVNTIGDRIPPPRLHPCQHRSRGICLPPVAKDAKDGAPFVVVGVTLFRGNLSSLWRPLESKARGERVSQGHTETCGSGRTELLIIVDEVEVGLRANKEVAAEIVAEAGAEVTHEMITADKVGAT